MPTVQIETSIKVNKAFVRHLCSSLDRNRSHPQFDEFCRSQLMTEEVAGSESSRLKVPTQLAARLSSLSIDEEYFAPSQTPAEPPRPASTDLPASLALPLSRTRSSTSPNTPASLRAGPSISVDDDSASIRSFVPTISVGDDLEAMLSEMLGSETRWRIEDGDDIDIWEGQSEDESDSDSDTDGEFEDDGISSSFTVNGRG
jgi:hypothetical protein